MMQISGTKALKDQNEHLLALASVLGYPMTQLRANHFRTAERALTHLNHFFTSERAQVCKEWLSTQQSIAMLRKRLARFQELEQKSSKLEQEMAELEEALLPWRQVTASERRDLKALVSEIRAVLDHPQTPAEAAILERHELYHQLKGLVPYAEEVDHLCAAVKHYSRREEYEAERKDLERKITSANERQKSVKRGFVLALIMCVFVVTIPLCVPFAFSLWNRLRDIRLQHAQLVESRRRVLRKLELAAEGVIAAEDITSVLGERSLADVRSVLDDVRKLHLEFSSVVESAPPMTKVLVMMGRAPELVERVFGRGPESLRERLAWIVRMQELRTRQSQEIVKIASEIVATRESIQQHLKGYNPQILEDTIERLQDRLEAIEPTDVSREFFGTYTRMCKGMPRALENAQSVLSKVSYGKEVTDSDWTKAGLAIVNASTTMNAIVAEAELAQKEGLSDDDRSSDRSAHLFESAETGTRGKRGSAVRTAMALILCVLSWGGWTRTGSGPAAGSASDFASVFPLSVAHAADENWVQSSSRAVANYYQDRLSIDGTSTVPDGINRSGLEAEIVSRRAGVDALGTQLQKVCKDTSLATNWKDLVRSNGSEIYPNRTIKILLIGKLSEVITASQEVTRTPLTGTEGKPLAFRIPTAIPLAATQCGALVLEVPEAGQVRVFPALDRSLSGADAVTLSFDASKPGLKPATARDAELLKNSNLVSLAGQAQGSVIRLPLTSP